MNQRPRTLAEIADQADSLETFGLLFQDWLHEVRRMSSRRQAWTAVLARPATLAGRFAEGSLADAWLGAYAEHVALRLEETPPAWAFEPGRILQMPWFSNPRGSTVWRIGALRDSPLAFKRRNLFTPSVQFPLRLRAGRPERSAEEKRAVNRERQHRFQERRRAELRALRAAVHGMGT